MEITPFNFVTHSFIAAKGHNSKAQNCNVHSTLQHYCHSLLTNCLEDFNYLLSCILGTKTFRLSLDFSPHKATCSLTCRKTKLNPATSTSETSPSRRCPSRLKRRLITVEKLYWFHPTPATHTDRWGRGGRFFVP